MGFHELAEAELLVIESVYQFSHGLDSAAELGSILLEPGRGEVVGPEGLIYRISCPFATLQSEKNTGGENRIQEGKGVAARIRPSAAEYLDRYE